MRALLDRLMAGSGAFAWGVAPCHRVTPDVSHAYDAWLGRGSHAGMAYLANHRPLRDDPALLLEGCRSIVSAAFAYPASPADTPLLWAGYALGDDYHDVLRARLSQVAALLEEAIPGCRCRVCVDTAPLIERYWAVQAGLGFIGRNRALIIPGAGSRFFLGEILATTSFTSDEPLHHPGCGDCRRCLDACPGKALREDGLDASKCLSYLTIEHRGDFPAAMPPVGRRIYGCDTCQDVCLYNQVPPPPHIPEFLPRPGVAALTAAEILHLSPEAYAALFRGSAVKRAKLDGLRRNARLLLDDNT